LEEIEGQETYKKRDDEDDPRRRRSRGRKIGSLRINRGRMGNMVDLYYKL